MVYPLAVVTVTGWVGSIWPEQMNLPDCGLLPTAQPPPVYRNVKLVGFVSFPSAPPHPTF